MPRKPLIIVNCRYQNCPYGGRINRHVDEFVQNGRLFYHKDCYENYKAEKAKDERTENDLKLFRKVWVEKINRTVVWIKLNKMLDDYVKRGVSTDQLLFTLFYVIEHKMKLTYPDGFKYYVDKEEIKDAYMKKKQREVIAKSKKEYDAKSKDLTDVDNALNFNVPKRKTVNDLF